MSEFLGLGPTCWVSWFATQCPIPGVGRSGAGTVRVWSTGVRRSRCVFALVRDLTVPFCVVHPSHRPKSGFPLVVRGVSWDVGPSRLCPACTSVSRPLRAVRVGSRVPGGVGRSGGSRCVWGPCRRVLSVARYGRYLVSLGTMSDSPGMSVLSGSPPAPPR
jgi:hypothetical protein